MTMQILLPSIAMVFWQLRERNGLLLLLFMMMMMMRMMMMIVSSK